MSVIKWILCWVSLYKAVMLKFGGFRIIVYIIYIYIIPAKVGLLKFPRDLSSEI